MGMALEGGESGEVDVEGGEWVRGNGGGVGQLSKTWVRVRRCEKVVLYSLADS